MTEGFQNELHAILTAELGRGAREQLIASCRRRPAAGLCCISYPREKAEPWATNIEWVEDLSGELDGTRPEELARRIIDATPSWLMRWGVRRPQPFHLHRVARFIPFSAAALLRASAPPGRRKLQDFIVVTSSHGERGFAIFMGLFEPLAEPLANEFVVLAAACLARQPWRGNEVPLPALSERQLECIQWVIAGKSLAEVAVILGTSYANVRYHLERAKARTGLGSLQQLVAYAAVEYSLSPFGPERSSRDGPRPSRQIVT